MQENKYIKKYFLKKEISFKDRIITLFSKILINIPIIRNYYLKFFDLLCIYLSTVLKNNNLEEFYKVSLRGLENKYYSKADNAEKWWALMRIAIACLQQEQLTKFLVRPNVETKLMILGEDSKHKKSGYDASYCFVGFSLWAFERGLIDKSIEFAQIAQKAYSKWGYPDYLIGWFGLFNNQINSVNYFCNAIEKDWSMLHRIRHDPTCQLFPDVVKEVSQKFLVRNNNKLH